MLGKRREKPCQEPSGLLLLLKGLSLGLGNSHKALNGLLPQGYGDKHITLYDIRAELSCRYKDLRTAYRSPNTEEIFNMLTKETPETFYIGKYWVCFLGVEKMHLLYILKLSNNYNRTRQVCTVLGGLLRSL